MYINKAEEQQLPRMRFRFQMMRMILTVAMLTDVWSAPDYGAICDGSWSGIVRRWWILARSEWLRDNLVFGGERS